jgi:uroporphyrinogen-III decarboxylase
VTALGGRTRLHVCGNTRFALAGMGRLGCAVVDLDSPSPMAQGRAEMGPDQVLLGNVNPVTVLRDGTPEQVTAAVAACHAQAGRRFVVGAGCEVPRDTPPANLRALCAYGHTHGP